MSYVNLRVYTTASYETKQGMVSYDELIEKIKKNPETYGNKSAFAISDRNNMFSHVGFYKSAKKHSDQNFNLKPIIACDLIFNHIKEQSYQINETGNLKEYKQGISHKYPLLLIAKNNNGYLNLSKLQTEFYIKNDKGDRINEDVLKENPELIKDLFVLSGGNKGYLFDKYLEYRNQPNQETLNDIKEHILFWKNISNNNYFVEIQRDGTLYENDFIKFIVPLSVELSVPVVATNNTYFINREDFKFHELYAAKRAEKSVFQNKLGLKNQATPENYFKSEAEMLELFKDIPVAVKNTQYIADNANVDLELNKHNYIPEISSGNPDEDINDYFVRVSNEGLDNLMYYFYTLYADKNNKNIPYDSPSYNNIKDYFEQFKELHPIFDRLSYRADKDTVIDEIKKTSIYKKYKERLDFEVDIILKMKFPSYFMVVSDFIKWAKNNAIPVGPGRGSGAGSLVAYVLHITSLDPLQFNLLFERFLNPERVSMPDFDIDFSATDKSKVLEYIKQKYSSKDAISVAKIMNVSKFAVASSIEFAGQAYGFPNNSALIKSIKDLFKVKHKDESEEDEEDEQLDSSFFETVLHSNEFKTKYKNSILFRNIVDFASKMYGNMRTISIHASGIAITSQPLETISPIMKYDGDIITQQDKNISEEQGIVKFDLLSLANLNIMNDCIREINKSKRQNNEPEFSFEELDNINLYNQEVYQNIFQTGNTANVFQFASAGMVNMLKKYQPDCFEDLIALVALYRPGPMDKIPEYIAAKKNPSLIKKMTNNPEFNKILEETYGFFVYQEQVMQAAMIYAGYSLGQADLLRRAMGKKKPEEMAKHKAIFLIGSFAKKGFNLSEEQKGFIEDILKQQNKDVNDIVQTIHSNSLFKDESFDFFEHIKEALPIFITMEEFANYGFNKSHAAAYAKVAFQTAYLKHYYPKEYLVSVLAFQQNDSKDKMVIYETIQDAKNNGVKVLPIDINHSKSNFHLDKDGNIVSSFGLMKGVNKAELIQIEKMRDLSSNFTSIMDFMNKAFENNIGVSKNLLGSLILIGAFDKLNNSKSNKFFLENIEKFIKFFETEYRDNSIIYNLIPTKLRKPVGRKSNVPVSEFMTSLAQIDEDYLLEEKLLKEIELLEFLQNYSGLKKLMLSNKEMLGNLFQDGNQSNLYDITSSYNEIHDVVFEKVKDDQAVYIESLNRNPKANYFNKSSTSSIITGIVINEEEINKHDQVTKYYTICLGDDDIIKVSYRGNSIKKKEIKLGQIYYFVLESRAIAPDENTTKFNMNMSFYLQDYHPLEEMYHQIVKTASFKFDNNDLNYRFNSNVEEQSKLIKNIIDKYGYSPVKQSEEGNMKLFAKLPNQEDIEFYLNSKIYEEFKKESIFIDFVFHDKKLVPETGKLNLSSINGKITKNIDKNLMLEELKENKMFTALANYFEKKGNSTDNLTVQDILEENSEFQNKELLTYAYISNIKKTKDKKQISFTDSNGYEFKTVSVDNQSFNHLRENEPCIAKVEVKTFPTFKNVYLKDIYFANHIEDMNLGSKFYIQEDKNRFIEILDSHNIDYRLIDNFNGINENDKQLMIKFEKNDYVFDTQAVVIDKSLAIDLFSVMKENKINRYRLFDFNEYLLTKDNLPPNYDLSSQYENRKTYIENVELNPLLNKEYLLGKTDFKMTDMFLNIDYIEKHKKEFAKQNEYDNRMVMILVMVKNMVFNEEKDKYQLEVFDAYGKLSFTFDKAQTDLIDFQKHIDEKIPFALKIQINPDKRNENNVFYNVKDFYAIEDIVSCLSESIKIKTDMDNYAVIEETAMKYQPKQHIGLPVIITNDEGENLSIRKAPIVVKYSEWFFQEIKEKLNLSDNDIYINYNKRLQIRPNKFPNQFIKHFDAKPKTKKETLKNT